MALRLDVFRCLATGEVAQDTTGGALIEAAERYPDCPALVFGERTATYAELLGLVIERARSLIGLGIARGDQVGILMPNCWDYVILYLAINLIGGRAVLLNARYRPDDLRYVIPKADLRFLLIGGHAVAHCDYRPMLAEIFPEIDQATDGRLNLIGAPLLEVIVEFGEGRPGHLRGEAWFGELASGISQNDVLAAAAAVAPDDVGLMIFTSGTTARPKACMVTHLSLCLTGRAVAQRFRLAEQDVVWDPLPLFHMSTILPMAACRSVGACFVGMTHFDVDAAINLLIEVSPTVHYAGFPAIISALIAHPKFADYDQSNLRINHVVGPPDLLRRYAKHFPRAVAVNSYGLTEATGVPCYSPLDDPEDLLYDTNGALFDGMEVYIADPDGGRLPNGQSGEICLRGFGIFAGYYGDPTATADVVTPDGWLHTGDLGRIGKVGRLVFEGRLKDMLKIGGENVAAVELESFLMTHPAVRMAQVIGVPDERLMEVPAAFVEIEAGSSVTAEELVRHCFGSIASFKIPRYIRFVSKWPMSSTKIQKFALRDMFEPVDKINIKDLRMSSSR